jgi:activator of 2-hydroxyglutaryl-CoA dehydratase
MIEMLRQELACELVVPEQPEYAVAIGAALIGIENAPAA